MSTVVGTTMQNEGNLRQLYEVQTAEGEIDEALRSQAEEASAVSVWLWKQHAQDADDSDSDMRGFLIAARGHLPTSNMGAYMQRAFMIIIYRAIFIFL